MVQTRLSRQIEHICSQRSKADLDTRSKKKICIFGRRSDISRMLFAGTGLKARKMYYPGQAKRNYAFLRPSAK